MGLPGCQAKTGRIAPSNLYLKNLLEPPKSSVKLKRTPLPLIVRLSSNLNGDVRLLKLNVKFAHYSSDLRSLRRDTMNCVFGYLTFLG